MDISVIIPIYNSDKHLYRCLKSLIHQRGVDCEFICINDGSTDYSKQIIDQFVTSDKRFRYIEKKHNGVSAARNVGLDTAQGRYVCFLDSDDYIKKNSLYKLYQTAEKYQCDVIKFNAKVINGYDWMKQSFIKHDELIKDFSKKDVFTYKDCRPFIWCHFIKRDVIKNQRFDTNIQIGEDQEFIIRYLHDVNTILFTSKKYYVYHNHADSSINRCGEEKICRENIKLVKKVASFIEDKSDLYKKWVFDTLYYSFEKTNRCDELRSEILELLISEQVYTAVSKSNIKIQRLLRGE